MSKDKFISFIKIHPELITQVNNNKTTWQKLYDVYSIYGENDDIWNKYILNKETSTLSSLDLFSFIKNIDLESVQKGVSNLQKTITMIQDFGVGEKREKKDTYEPRPLYKYFDD